MTVRQGIKFRFPRDWNTTDNDKGFKLSLSSFGQPVEVEIRVMPLPVSVTERLKVLSTMQVTLGGCYPAYQVQSLFERPLAAGACIEAELKPRAGSQLLPARMYAMILSKHLVLFDFRRPETAEYLDPIVRRFVHGIRESGVSVKGANEFANTRREKTSLVRRGLQQWQVFLCHNSKDKSAVRELRDKLFEQGIVSWFDENEIELGTGFIGKMEKGLASVDAVIVAHGKHGLGDWQELEYGVALNQYIQRKRSGGRELKIIPVALPGAPPLATWAGFLGTFNGVEFKTTLTKTGVNKLVKEILPG